MPNFNDRVIQGAGTRGNVGTYKTESLPNITGKTASSISQGGLNWNSNGALYGSRTNNGYVNNNFATNYNLNDTINFDASLSSSTYQNSAPVQPNALLIQCCIKY